MSRYSRDLNVFIIVLDALQSDFFRSHERFRSFATRCPRAYILSERGVPVWADGIQPAVHPDIEDVSRHSIHPSVGRGSDGSVVPARLVERGFDAVLVGFTPDVPCDFER